MTRNGLIFSCLLVVSYGSAESPQISDVTSLAKAVEAKARQWERESGFNSFKEAYAGALSRVQFVDVDGVSLVSAVAAELSKKVFEPKIEAIKYAVDETEKIAASYKWQALPKESSTMPPNVTWQYSSRHRKNVSFDYSQEHVPVDIFRGGVDILNGLEWTSNLTQIFARNQAKYPDLLWQYFGSHQGLMRYYPGATWDVEGDVDLYDARRRPWYIQGSSSPKDMLILIDSSGSTLGQTLYLMKLTVRLLLETLGEDDFVLVANFSEKANLVTGCFESFVQATALNKKILNDAIDQIDPQKQANFTAALEFAFKHFEKLEAARNSTGSGRTFAGSGCNKLIVMLTDGGSERPVELIRHHDPDGSKYRIFTYAVGQSPSPLDAVTWLACANHGWYSRIENIGAIQPSIQKYVEVLADVTAQHSQSTPLHHLSDMYSSDLGKEMLTTLTMPVFNKSKPDDVTFLGVMGIDVPVQQITSQLPKSKMGPTGYAFAVNHNGFVLFHPWLKTQDGTRANPPSIDIIDLEYLGDTLPDERDRKDEMRQKMVDGGADSNYTYDDTLVLYGDLKYVKREKRSYFASKIANTSYSLGISLPDKTVEYVNLSFYANTTRALEALQQLKSQNASVTQLMNGGYCQLDSSDRELADKIMSLSDVIDCLRNSSDLSDDSLVHLIWDAEAAKTVLHRWQHAIAQEYNDTGTVQHLLSSVSGLSVAYPVDGQYQSGNETRWIDGKDNKLLEKPATLSAAAERAYHRPDETVFALSSDVDLSEGPPRVLVLRAISVKGYTPAVAGVSASYWQLQEVLSSDPACPANATCYLLDEGGFMVASADNYSALDVGKFVGDVDRSLLNLLLNSSIYEMYERLDYQGEEPKSPKSSTASSRLRIGSVSQFLYAVVNQWWSMAAIYASQLYSLLTSVLFAAHANHAVASATTAGGRNVTVIKKSLCMFGSANATEAEKHVLDQDGCRRWAMVRRVSGTNLLLVVTDSGYDEDACNRLPIKSVFGSEQLREFSCKRAARYRNSQAQPCHRHDKRKNKYVCGASISASIGAWPLGLFSLVVMVERSVGL